MHFDFQLINIIITEKISKSDDLLICLMIYKFGLIGVCLPYHSIMLLITSLTCSLESLSTGFI